jgi:carboxypeptidase C (cathepsin A)
MYAGHVEVTPEHHGNMFFWFHKNRHIANRQRTVIWLNGGPGCSSMDGALMEIGPYRVKKDGNLALNDGSWDEFANLLFIDNPVGTGFSYVDTDSYVHELDEMANQMVIFLEKWFAIFPEHARDDVGTHSSFAPCNIADTQRRSTLLANLTLVNTSHTLQRQWSNETRTRATTSGTSAGF